MGDIPATVSAVVFNLTVANPQSNGFITAYASGTVRPDAANLNFNAGQIVPNLVTVPVGADGKVNLHNCSAGTSELIADVAGYYLPGAPTATGAFQAVTHSRLLDTRTTPLVSPESTVSFQVAGADDFPAPVSAAAFNLTVTERQTVPNLAVVPVGPDGKVSIFNRSSGTSQLIADVAGYFLP
ncbi:MAG: hypothetical protein NVS1B16_06190 [Pseudarthrobacter sp.]